MNFTANSLAVSANVRALARGLAAGASVVILTVVSGCGSLTRVDTATHIREVEGFQLMGLHHDEAVRRIKAAGFTCSPYKEKAPMVWSFGAKVPVFTRTCSKASFEIFCPQRRYVVFHYTPEQEQVVYVEHPPRIEEHSCF